MIGATEEDLISMLDRRRHLMPQDLAAVAAHVGQVGKHHLSRSLLDAAVRRAMVEEEPTSRLFLECVSDRHRQKFTYATYTCLPLLDPLIAQWDAPLILEMLVRDIIDHERRGPLDQSDVSKNAIARKRISAGGKLLDTVRGWESRDHVGSIAREDIRLALQATAMPVDTWPDEYMFIRLLQSYECIFELLLNCSTTARDQLTRFDAAGAEDSLRSATRFLTESTALFSLMATVHVEQFTSFRIYTHGASAIQSRRYKQFESACCHPPKDRLESISYAAVPDVQLAVRRASPSIASAFLAFRQSTGSEASQDLSGVLEAMSLLERAHSRWKQTHYSIASRFLRDAPGTGGTPGVAYLKAVREYPLFWQLSIPSRPAPDARDNQTVS